MHLNQIIYLFFIVISSDIYNPNVVIALYVNELTQTQENPGVISESESDNDKEIESKHLIYINKYDTNVNGHGYENIKTENSSEALPDVKQLSDDDSKPAVNKTLKEYDPDALCMNFYRETPESNQVCSSLSTLLPMGKLALGAKGRTLKELLKLFNLSSKALAKERFSSWIHNLIAVKYNDLDVASNIFVDVKMPIKEGFTEITQSVFNSSVIHIDMVENATNAAYIINDWVKNSTHGEIKELLHSTDIEKSPMVIVNALYFKGTWLKPFKNTVQESFHTPFGDKNCDMMKNKDTFLYTESKALDSQILQLPFHYHEINLYIVLPDKKYGLTELLNTLKKSPKLLDEAKTLLRLSNVNVSLPKFSTVSTIQMNSLVQDEGVQEIFESEADFSDMTSEKIHVGQIVQKTVMHIDEKGATFAGATGIVMEPESEIEISEGVKTFHADHPFLYFLEIDKDVLLSGILNAPSLIAKPGNLVY